MRTRPLSYACLLFATLCGAYFLVFFQRLSLGVIMPSLTEDLGLTPSMTGWLGSAFLYAYAATQIPAGLLVDNWGPRRTMLLLFGMGGVGGLLFASAASLGTALAGRALVGVGMAFIFLSGSTTGGSDVVGYLLQKKYPHVSIGRALMMIDGIILSTSIFVFGNVDAALFGLISLYAQTKVIDMIIYGNDAGSEASIVTKYPQKIAERVIKEIDRTVTLLPGKGGYSGEDTTVVLCTVRKTEFNRLKRIIAETDENAFVIVKETSGIFGLGFKDVAEAQQ